MRKSILIVTLCTVANLTFAQSNDPVIMKINGQEITRSEFEYSYNKNNAEGVIDKKDVQEYVQLYIDYKLKVEEAKAQGFDKDEKLMTELQGYREQIVFPTLENPNFVEKNAYETYKKTLEHYGDDKLVDCQHILVRMKQDDNAEQQAKAKATIDSIYTCLQNGEDFDEIAKKCSQDPGTAQQGGKLPKFGKGMTLPEFEQMAYSLKDGELSKPFKTAAGWHIVKLNSLTTFGSFEEHHDNIVKFLQSQPGFQEAGAEALVDSLAKERGVEKDVVFQELFEKLVAQDDEMKNLAQEYYDGTLMFEASKRLVWDKAAADSNGLQQYFKKNKKKYAWTEPHFKGIVVHAKDKQTFDQAKKITKKTEQKDWATEIVTKINTSENKVVRVEKLGVFKKGDNRFVDKHVFKSAEDLQEYNDYPYSQVIGKMMKQPKSYEDVRGQVVADYQKKLEDEWVLELRKKFPVEVYQDVVNTVNNH